jgi:hypothetical protein
MLLKENNLMIAKADKSRTMVIIHKVTMKQKINTFIPKNQIIHLNKDPTQNHFENTFNKQCTKVTQ